MRREFGLATLCEGLPSGVAVIATAGAASEILARVMIEKFATSSSQVPSEFLDLNHTSKSSVP
jgi:hypothetical protein